MIQKSRLRLNNVSSMPVTCLLGLLAAAGCEAQYCTAIGCLSGLNISVSFDGTKLGEQTFEPAYSSREINGPGCGVCAQGGITFRMP